MAKEHTDDKIIKNIKIQIKVLEKLCNSDFLLNIDKFVVEEAIKSLRMHSDWLGNVNPSTSTYIVALNLEEYRLLNTIRDFNKYKIKQGQQQI